jgi:hypothetical protein
MTQRVEYRCEDKLVTRCKALSFDPQYHFVNLLRQGAGMSAYPCQKRGNRFGNKRLGMVCPGTFSGKIHVRGAVDHTLSLAPSLAPLLAPLLAMIRSSRHFGPRDLAGLRSTLERLIPGSGEFEDRFVHGVPGVL